MRVEIDELGEGSDVIDPVKLGAEAGIMGFGGGGGARCSPREVWIE